MRLAVIDKEFINTKGIMIMSLTDKMNRIRKAIVVFGCSATLFAPGLSAQEQDISVGHLTYHTGEYGGFGPFFDGVADFSLAVINDDPPLGRKLTVIHEDIGTVGEDNAARNLISNHNVDVLLNAAHGYLSYRDFVLQTVSDRGLPLMPSVHGGGIESKYGGNAAEPIFRGSPMDTGQGIAALLHARNSGKKSVVLVATQAAGSQLQIELAANVAREYGLEVRGTIDMYPSLNDYSPVVDLISYLNAEAVVFFSAPADGGAIVKAAAENGEQWFIVGSSEWQEESFYNAATQKALEQHQEVTLAAFSYEDNPAWDYYHAAAEASPQAQAIGDPSNSYALQYYDLLVATALAIEHAGDVNTQSWSASMFEVTGGDGKTVYTYEDGIAAMRAGEKINYDGVTGSMEYSGTGVVSGIFGIFKWNSDKSLEKVEEVDGEEVLQFSR